MSALETIVIYFTPFIAIGLVVKFVLKKRMKGVDLSEVQAQAGANRGKRRVFLLGAWRNEE